MSLFDWTILGLYCALILGLALYFQKRASGGVVEFFAAGRDLPWWVIGFADVAGYTGGGQGFVMLLFLSGYSGPGSWHGLAGSSGCHSSPSSGRRCDVA